MTECKHMIGMSRTTVTQNGEIVTTWLTEVWGGEAGKIWWQGYRFSYCPLCGADVRELANRPLMFQADSSHNTRVAQSGEDA